MDRKIQKLFRDLFHKQFSRSIYLNKSMSSPLDDHTVIHVFYILKKYWIRVFNRGNKP